MPPSRYRSSPVCGCASQGCKAVVAVLALHAQDILAICVVLLVWVGLQRLRRASRKRDRQDG